MNEDSKQRWEVWGVGLVVTLAVLVGLRFKGISGESVAEAVKDVGAALIPILAAFLAARIVTGEMDPADRFQQAGEEALRALQRSRPDILSGPKANSEDYDSENPGKRGRYLFVQKRGQGRKGQLIPVTPLREGIVEIRVNMTALLVLGLEREGLEQVQQQVVAKVRAEVTAMLQRDWEGSFELLAHKSGDVAVVVDFDESKLGPRRFTKAVIACGTAALRALPMSKP